MAKFEIIVRETRVLKYKVDAPTQQIAVDRIITDYPLNPQPYQTQRISRELYAVDLEVKETITTPAPNLQPYPRAEVEPEKTEPPQKRKKK
jgi:hypothetical protein